MPFTASHVAAILPLKKTRLVASALVFGAMAPDFEYFLYFTPHGKFGHTLLGLFLLTTPLGLAALWMFHRSVKRALITLLPNSVQQRLGDSLGEFRFGGLRRFGLIVASIVVGAATHIAWDSFTHERSWLVENSTLLQHTWTIAWLRPYPIPLYRILQHSSTLLGLGVLAASSVLWFRRTEPTRPIERTLSPAGKAGLIGLIILLALLGGLLSATLASPEILSGTGRVSAFGSFIVTTIALLWWELVVFGVWTQKWSSEPL